MNQNISKIVCPHCLKDVTIALIVRGVKIELKVLAPIIIKPEDDIIKPKGGVKNGN